LHDNNEGKGTKSVRFEYQPEKAGRYEVRCSYTAHPNRATNVPVTVRSADGVATLHVNQRKAPPEDRIFVGLGIYRLEAGRPGVVEIGTAGTDGYVIADAVQWVPVR
jgi:hypothetical protein